MRILASLLVNLLLSIHWVLTWPRRKWARPTPWINARLGDRMAELEPPTAGWLLRRARADGPQVRSVQALRELVDQLARAPRQFGLLLHMPSLSTGWATLESARDVLVRARAEGRRIVVYLEEGADQRALFLASAADEIWLGPSAGITALGPVSRRTYVGALLRRVGVDVAVSAAGDYKSAADGLILEHMSPADREQRAALLAAVLTRWNGALRERRPELPAPLLDAAVLGPEGALALGAVDHIGYADDVERALGIEDERPAKTPADLPGLSARVAWRSVRLRPHIAVMRLTGAIGVGARGVGLKSTRDALRTLAKRSNIAAVVLWIDSPGGSAVVSDLLHHEIVLLDAKKPVFAVFGDVAASGGYYLGAAARRIWARPTTVTGSIGVISVRAAVGALLQRFDIHVESLAATPAADLFRFTTPLSPGEAALFEAETQRFYTRFLDVVASGRKLSVDAVRRVAGGRVWAGDDALTHGLVDALGGLPEALAYVRAELASGGTHVEAEPRYYAARASRGLLSMLAGELTPSPLGQALTALSDVASLATGAGIAPLALMLPD